jgi:transcriptional regulator with XRE-family HTH domain
LQLGVRLNRNDRKTSFLFTSKFNTLVKVKMAISGKQVEAARVLLGLTQGELAKAAGVSEITIRRYETNVQVPNTRTLAKILEAIEMRGIEFTNGTGIGVRLNYEKAAEFARSSEQKRPLADR